MTDDPQTEKPAKKELCFECKKKSSPDKGIEWQDLCEACYKKFVKSEEKVNG